VRLCSLYIFQHVPCSLRNLISLLLIPWLDRPQSGYFHVRSHAHVMGLHGIHGHGAAASGHAWHVVQVLALRWARRRRHIHARHISGLALYRAERRNEN